MEEDITLLLGFGGFLVLAAVILGIIGIAFLITSNAYAVHVGVACIICLVVGPILIFFSKSGNT